MRILFTLTNRGFAQVGSRLIRAFEGGIASHCGAVLPDGCVVDVSFAKGTHVWEMGEFLRRRELVADIEIALPDEDAALAYAQKAIDEHHEYDILDVLSFLAWRDIGIAGRDVCSGFLLRMALAGGLVTAERIKRFGVRHLVLLAEGRAK